MTINLDPLTAALAGIKAAVSPENMTDDELRAELLPAYSVEAEWKLPADRICDAINALPVKTAKTMAAATAAALKTLCAEIGFADSEVVEREPNDPRCYFDNGDCYVVAWEAGPYEWAIPTSMAIGSRCGKLVEPYYSFDLCFYPAEDAA